MIHASAEMMEEPEIDLALDGMYLNDSDTEVVQTLAEMVESSDSESDSDNVQSILFN